MYVVSKVVGLARVALSMTAHTPHELRWTSTETDLDATATASGGD
jgi:hypothetical protein